MWREIKLLVVDDDDQRRRDIKVILDFLGEVNVTLSSDNWQEKAVAELGGTEELVAVLVGSTQLSLARMVQAVADWNEGLPVILMSEHPEYELLDDSLRHRVIARLSMPPTYNKLLDTLHRA